MHEIQVLLPWVGQVINCCGLQGTSVVAGNGDDAAGDRVESAQAVDRCDNGIQSCKLTPVRVTFFHRTRDSVVAEHTVIWGCTFNDKGRGAQSVTQGTITHRYSSALGNGSGHCEPVVVGLGMLHCPQTSGGKSTDSCLESQRGHSCLQWDRHANVLHSGNGS